MKKLVTLVAVAAMTSLVACGPSAEEKAAMEQKKQDSIRQDSIAKAEAQMQMEKMRNDSIAKADSMAKAAAIADSIAKAAEKKGGKKK